MFPNIGSNKSDSPKQEVNDKIFIEKTIDSLHFRAMNEVILHTLVVNVHGIKKEHKARAIIDTGLQKSYILKSTAEDLSFNLQREEEFCHSLFGKTKTRIYKHKCHKIYLSSLDGNYICKLDALDNDVICNDISNVKNGSWIPELKTKTIFSLIFKKTQDPLRYFWVQMLPTDSSTVLKCITRREQWSVFFTNRISEIRKLTTSEDWFHISTDQNPVDILSRGCGPKQLQKRKWWQRPAGYRIRRTSGQSQL
ncbi:uncharacterized protein NPIL_182761 [Nephila pilipes]|uniref:Peptidase aspartic putative domain-containing protein n=1 Tax=Nephila pilipes TaxID=299642 RepID=A0A8X6U8Y2_NEPPI|nr:uncharacterized protein NPIL_182761 [Nephila pilipes]